MTTESAAEPRARGPIPRLDADTILEAGLAIAARPGVSSITVRELGAMIGADPTAVYRHFRSKDILLQALLDRLLGLARDRITVPPTQWRDFLREFAMHVMGVFREYPVIGAEATRLSSNGANELEVLEDLLAAFRAAGLDERETNRYYGVFTAFTLSFSSGIVRTLEPAAEGAPHTSLWVDRPLDVTEQSHPNIHALRPRLLTLRDSEIYAMGVDLIVESAERAGAAGEG